MKRKRISKIIHSGLRMMSRSKLRTFFMMLGIIIGITALTLTLTIGNGIEKKIMNNVQRFFNPNNLVVTGETVSAEGLRESEAGPNTTLKIEDAEYIANQLNGLVQYDYLHIIPQINVNYSGVNHFVSVKGCRDVGQIVWNKPLASGVFFDESDVRSSKRVAVLGPKIANILFGEEDPIGKQFRIGNSPFIVIGIAKPQGADPHGADLDEEIYIPITTLLRRVANLNYLTGIKFEFENSDLSIEAESVVRNILRERHSLSEGEVDDFTILTTVQVRAIVDDMIKVFKVLLPAIAAIALLAGAIVIVVLMNISVNQRTKEIGLRKAIGAKDEDISTQFLAESIAVVLFGGIIGLIFGLTFSKLISDKLNATFYIPLQTVVVGILLPIFTGLIAGIMPARKAAKLNPVDTMK